MHIVFCQSSAVLVLTTSDFSSRELAAKEEARQLTIFYGGKVVVVDNFPSAKVKELLQMANAGDGALDKAGTGNAVPQSLPQPAQSSLPGTHSYLFCSSVYVQAGGVIRSFSQKKMYTLVVQITPAATCKNAEERNWFTTKCKFPYEILTSHDAVADKGPIFFLSCRSAYSEEELTP